MTGTSAQSSKWQMRTHTQVCPPARTSEASWRGQEALPHLPWFTCTTVLLNITCQSNSLGRKQEFPEVAHPSAPTQPSTHPRPE